MHELVANSSCVQQVIAVRVVSSALGQALESSAGRDIAPLVRAAFTAPLQRCLNLRICNSGARASAASDAHVDADVAVGVGVGEAVEREVSEQRLSACVDALHALCVRCATATLPSGALLECLLGPPLLALFALLCFTFRSASLIRYSGAN